MKVTTWKLQNIKDETYNFKDLVECEAGDWVSIDDYEQLRKTNYIVIKALNKIYDTSDCKYALEIVDEAFHNLDKIRDI